MGHVEIGHEFAYVTQDRVALDGTRYNAVYSHISRLSKAAGYNSTALLTT